MENEEFACIRVGERNVRLTEENTEVYNYNPKIVDELGSLATRDHVWITYMDDDVEPPVKRAAYIWKHNPVYEKIATQAVASNVPVRLNLRAVQKLDQETFERHLKLDLDNSASFPEEWETSD